MIDLWPLIGVAIITFGLALRLNTLLVILVAGLVTGLVAQIAVVDILAMLGASFSKNRYMSLFILVLPMIGVLERYGLRERAETLIGSMKSASTGLVLLTYVLVRKVTNGMGLNLGGHPTMIRPLVAPMAEAAAHKNRSPLSEAEIYRVRTLAAMSENFGNFFSQLAFIGAGGLLLIKGVFEDSGYDLKLSEMYQWALPTALASFIIFVIVAKLADFHLKKQASKKVEM